MNTFFLNQLRKFTPRRLAGTSAVAIVLAGLAWPGFSQTNKVASLASPAAVKSVFVDDPRFGKNPFFPKSQYGMNQSQSTNSPVINMPVNLVLRGLSGPPTRRLAMINKFTLAEGESTEVKIEGRPVKLECVQIRDRSVLVRYNGSGPHELQLRQNL